MKILSLTLLLILVYRVDFAQTFKRAAFRIDSLPKQGVLLDKGWKWHAGDNPDFAKANFDDSAWDSIDPTKDIHNIPTFAKTGIGWLRLKLSLSNDLQEEQFALLIKQYIASEIYLNGKLLYSFGKISANSGKYWPIIQNHYQYLFR